MQQSLIHKRTLREERDGQEWESAFFSLQGIRRWLGITPMLIFDGAILDQSVVELLCMQHKRLLCGE